MVRSAALAAPPTKLTKQQSTDATMLAEQPTSPGDPCRLMLSKGQASSMDPETSLKPCNEDMRNDKEATLMQLQAKLQASQDACKGEQAEAKIHLEAWQAEAEKAVALSAMYHELQTENAAVKVRLAHLVSMVRHAEGSFYEHLTSTRATFCPDTWRELYQQLVGAVKPLFMHHE